MLRREVEIPTARPQLVRRHDICPSQGVVCSDPQAVTPLTPASPAKGYLTPRSQDAPAVCPTVPGP
jgi:hypothetical protein